MDSNKIQDLFLCLDEIRHQVSKIELGINELKIELEKEKKDDEGYEFVAISGD